MNFDFINPNVLWALPLSLLPLILHLLFRRPPQVVAFSDIRFLKKIYERYRPRRKLKEWVVLLLRILTLLFLFLFFARPTFNWGGKLGAENAMALVILLDSSYSMRSCHSINYRTRHKMANSSWYSKSFFSNNNVFANRGDNYCNIRLCNAPALFRSIKRYQRFA